MSAVFNRTISSLSILLAASALAACDSQPPKTADDAEVFRAGVDKPAWEVDHPSDYVTVSHVEETPPMVEVSGFIARVCNIPEPKFAFDSSKVENRSEPNLDALSRCMTEGAMKDEDIKLVGHADPRGPAPYNMALGQRRAGAVAEYLEHDGVSESRIVTSSRGELDAEGNSPSGWKEDRRVDIYAR